MDDLFDAYWADPTDVEALRVWSDALTDVGDPRGAFIRANLDDDQATVARLAKQKGKLVGPARPWLRTWKFGSTGLVARARCEAGKLAEGVEEIGRLNPHLILSVTSLQTKTRWNLYQGSRCGVSIGWTSFSGGAFSQMRP